MEEAGHGFILENTMKTLLTSLIAITLLATSGGLAAVAYTQMEPKPTKQAESWKQDGPGTTPPAGQPKAYTPGWYGGEWSPKMVKTPSGDGLMYVD